jgi:hypothetical protein
MYKNVNTVFEYKLHFYCSFKASKQNFQCQCLQRREGIIHVAVYLYEHLLYWKLGQMSKYWLIALFPLVDPALQLHLARVWRYSPEFYYHNIPIFC